MALEVNGHPPQVSVIVEPGPRGEKTVAQVLVGAGPDGLLPPGTLTLSNANSAQTAWYKKVRLMRRDATLGFLRDLLTGPLLMSEWTVTADHPEFEKAKEEIERSFVDKRVQFLRDVLRGFLDFGWAPFELVKYLDEETGHFRVTKIKALLQDLTTILVDYYGNLVGIKNIATFNVINPNPVYMFRGDYLMLYRDVEGTNWYSEPLMRRAERAYDCWNESDDAARRFDNKVAGATWVLQYPVGKTLFRGTLTDNAYIAQCVLDECYSSGKVAIPTTVAKFVDDLNSVGQDKLAWNLQLISAQTNQQPFVDRGKYLDALKARALGFPERAIFEGQFGTKAEAEAHADFAIDSLDMMHRIILTLLNSQGVDYLLEVNWGSRYKGHVKIEASPLDDSKRNMYRQLFMQHFGTPDGQALRADAIDWDAVQDEIGVPQKKSDGKIQRVEREVDYAGTRPPNGAARQGKLPRGESSPAPTARRSVPR